VIGLARGRSSGIGSRFSCRYRKAAGIANAASGADAAQPDGSGRGRASLAAQFDHMAVDFSGHRRDTGTDPDTHRGAQVADRPTELHHPSQKSLANVRGIRVELVRLYREGKAGLVDPILLGRLTTCLNVVQSMDNGTLADQRLTELEERLAVVRSNGHDHSHRARS
jgi:hypothetical protein